MSNLTIATSIQQEAQKAKSNIQKHIENALLPDEVKKMLLQDALEEQNPFYFCYASLFSEDADNAGIDKINIGGYFYYKYLITTDNYVDASSGTKNTLQYLVSSNFYLEESIRILSVQFISYPKFWQYWNLRKSEYLNAFKTDKKFLTEISVSDYETLADNKSANGKVGIDALYIMGFIDKHTQETLLQSHKQFSCGFQYYDDVLDLKQDILNKQTNIAWCELIKASAPEYIEELTNNPDKAVKLLHVKGIASMLLRRAINNFEEAETIVVNINCPLWKQAIELKKKEVKGILQNVDFYLASLKIKVKLSNKKTQSLNARECISLATEFIVNEQEQNGEWKDSPVNTWLSGYWTTGYVLNAIETLDEKCKSKINAKQALHYLQQKETTIFPYIKGWIEDADSTNFALLGLTANNQNTDNELQELLAYQKDDGGFTTYKSEETLLQYLNDPKITDVSGWTQSHICVSAGTLLLLSKFPDKFQKEKERLVKYLLGNISDNNLWQSYWWTSPIYSTALIIEAGSKIQHTALNNAIKNAIETLLKLQQSNGLFADEFTNKHIFYSALALNALCSDKEIYLTHISKIQLLAKAIVENQYEDGSFNSSFALRVPAANCLNPLDITQWKKTDLGENAIIEDIHRIITTSTALSALSRYEYLKQQCQN
ncbi:MAG TPA: prenyltransferase/squalene oxidase repeat-containing protein [Bacteroidia bacterium]|jgi:hypothetical protein|nr:prenyltransferase/squalene oxidase repeat-containing protein [Bacteroidia bacterium]